LFITVRWWRKGDTENSSGEEESIINSTRYNSRYKEGEIWIEWRN